MVGITFVIGICKYIDSICWARAGSLLTNRVRRDLFLHLMRSDVTFFDTNSIGLITTLISEDVKEIQSSFGTSKSIQVQCISQYISSFLFTFLYSWKMALIFLCSSLLLCVDTVIFLPGVIKFAKLSFIHASNMITIADEAISSIRTIRSYNREEYMKERFEEESSISRDCQRSSGIHQTVMRDIFMITIMARHLLTME